MIVDPFTGISLLVLAGSHVVQGVLTRPRHHEPAPLPTEPPTPENPDMPVGPETQAILDALGPRIQAAINAGAASAETAAAAKDDADTASALDAALTAAGAPDVPAPAAAAQ